MDIIGKKFNDWTVLSFSRNDKFGQPRYLCQCKCGKIKELNGYKVARGAYTCCRSCSSHKRFSIHNLAHSRIYRIWQNMKQRCYNENSTKFPIYGARGIKVCDEWRDSFISFHNWSVENGYSDELSIDRIDVNGDYCPENCRWSTTAEQNNNQRTNHIIEYKGAIYTLAEFCKKLNQKYPTIMARTRYYNTNNGEILLNPPKKSKSHAGKRKMIEYNGTILSRKDWCKKFGITESAYRTKQYKTKMSDYEIISLYLKSKECQKV